MLTKHLCRVLCTLGIVASFTLMSYVGVHQRNLLHMLGEQRNFDDTNNGRCLKNYFQDVMLVVVYHFPFYSTLPLILSHYKDAFPHIAVCGPKPSAQFQILVLDIGPGGYYSYECLGTVMRLHPGYRGYMFVNDDMIVNWWNFATLSKDKIWQGAKIEKKAGHEINERPIRNDWMWWTKENGLVSCEEAHKELVSAADKNFSSTPVTDVLKLLATHYRNGENKSVCFRTWADFSYVPGKFSREFAMLSRLFYEKKVFVEIAFPTILSMLDDWNEWEKANGVYLPEVFGFQDFSNVKYVWPKFSEDVAFLHPVKFFGNKGFQNRKIFKSRVLSFVRYYTSC